MEEVSCSVRLKNYSHLRERKRHDFSSLYPLVHTETDKQRGRQADRQTDRWTYPPCDIILAAKPLISSC